MIKMTIYILKHLDNDNKRKADQMAAETEERKRKEEELKKR